MAKQIALIDRVSDDLSGLPDREVTRLGDLVIDLRHDDPAVRRRIGRSGPVPFDAMVIGADVERKLSEFGSERGVRAVFSVEEHIGWLADEAVEIARSDLQGDLVKHISFLYAGEGFTIAEFRHDYRHHVGLARRHIPAMNQYVQNDVFCVTGPDAEACEGIVAISELWFASKVDFIERYFPTLEDEAAFRAHEKFIDLTRTFSFVAQTWSGREA